MMSNQFLGLHILECVVSDTTNRLTDALGWQDMMRSVLTDCGLHVVGETCYIFDNLGFTATFCLMESHVCIHTWPEFSRLTFDVFLCNHSRDNAPIVRKIAALNRGYFGGFAINQHEILR